MFVGIQEVVDTFSQKDKTKRTDKLFTISTYIKNEMDS